MTRMTVLAVAIVAIGASMPARLAAQGAGAWTTLFDGSSLKGWDVLGDANWALADGAVQATAGTGFLVTPRPYRDFQITLEVWASDDANSGVFIRCQDPKKIAAESCYEINIYDRRPDPTYRTGAIVNVARPAMQIDAGGRWNTLDITARGSRLTVTMNGMQTVDVEHTGFANGVIGLQYGGGIVRFRNIRIRAL